MRKHLLEYDDVVNEQRRVIYEQRDAIMADPDLIERVLSTARDELEAMIDETLAANVATERDLAALSVQLQSQLLCSPEHPPSRYVGLGRTRLVEGFLAELRADLGKKAAIIGPERFNLIIRLEYLHTIDIRWQQHLEGLEELREAVYLRGYAQKNPLLEYKLEGFKLFDRLIDTIRLSIARRILGIRAEGMQERWDTAGVPSQAQHRDVALLGGGAPRTGAHAAGRTAPRAGTRAVQVRRSVPKVGRNEPCPCGSGKKYKHCHGA